MRYFPLPFLILFSSVGTILTSTAQSAYEPTILVLSPGECIADEGLEMQLDSLNKIARKQGKAQAREIEASSEETSQRDSNIIIMYKKKAELSRQMDFYNQITSFSEDYLQYRFFERFSNLLVYGIPQKSTDNIKALDKLAKAHKMRYVLSFPQVVSKKVDGSKTSTVHFVLYDHISNQIVLQKPYSGRDVNPGFEFACKEGSWYCTFSNALSEGLPEVIRLVAENNPTLIQERQVAEVRNDVLLNSIYTRKVPKRVPSIINTSDGSIDTSGYYQAVVNEDTSKFVAFFCYHSETNSFKDIKNKKHGSVNIITEDFTNLDKTPSMYACAVVGLKFEGEWYFDVKNKTYFNASSLENGKREFFLNLIRWDYFKKGEAELNPQFWSTNFFGKVESSVHKNQDEIRELEVLRDQSKNSEDREIYQDMIDNYTERDLKNKPYMGMYNLVADELKANEDKVNEAFDSTLMHETLIPFFDDYVDQTEAFISYQTFNSKRIATIYPSDRSKILVPIVLVDKHEKAKLHFFVLVPNPIGQYALFKWHYLKPVEPEYRAYGGTINEQLNKVTRWNFTFDYLEDAEFWENYVFPRDESVAYKYLEKLK